MRHEPDPTTDLTLLEVASALGVAPSTLKNWTVRLPVPSRSGPDGEPRYPASAMEVLDTVKSLRDAERSYATIRRVIGPVPEGPPMAFALPPLQPTVDPLDEGDFSEAAARLWFLLVAELRWSGKLEARLATLEAENIDLQAAVDAPRTGICAP